MTRKTWFAPTREEILECLRSVGDPLTPAELAERLLVPAAHVESLNRRLLAMERDGQLLPNRKGVLLLASKLDLIAGKVQGHRDGFGFLAPDAGGADLFLSPREMQKAMHGDRVLVKLTGYDSRGRPEGRIVEVTERAHRRLVGRFLNERGVNIVVPEDQRIKHDIVIAPADTHDARHGQVVSVEIIDPPANGAPPIGRVVEVLGEIDDPGMEIEIAVRKFDVPHEFSDPALELAAAMPAIVRPVDRRGRVDLRDIELVTIDGEDARDFDDAVYCEPFDGDPGQGEIVGLPPGQARAVVPGGAYRLLVAIADVSHYVRPGDALDVDAAARSTSVYFPRRVIPMLPEKLSNGLCSLNPQVDRLVLVCDMVIDSAGQIRGYQFYEAVMHSAARLTYDETWAMLSGAPVAPTSGRAALQPLLRNLHDLYRTLARARDARGAMEIETIETKILCDPAGRIERIVPRGRNDAHRLIEECMLAANVCAADFMSRSAHPGLYRVHQGPTPDRLRMLREFLKTAGLSLGGGEEPTPRDYAELAARTRARPDQALMQAMILRSMQQAVYSPHNAGHFGLAYPAYAHFTSPIRRYPDLLTHRVIKALLRRERFDPVAFAARPEEAGDPSLAMSARRRKTTRSDRAGEPVAPQSGDSMSRWEQWGVVCSANERRADEASRDVEAWLKCMYVKEHVGEEFSGRITGVAAFGVFVTLDELYVEGMVHVSELGAEYFQYIEAAHELRGERTGRRFRLTDAIGVQVSRVDLEARRIEFRLVQRTDFRSLTRERERESKARAGEPPQTGSVASREPGVRKAARKSPGKGAVTRTARKSQARPARAEPAKAAGKKRRRS